MPGTEPARPLSPAKRALGILVLVAVVIISMIGGFYVSGGFGRGGTETPEDAGSQIFVAIALAVLGGLALAIGVGAYGLVYLTNCLTFDFSRPFFRAFKVKLYMANLFVGLLIVLGVSLIAAAFMTQFLRNLGLSSTVSILLPVMGSFIVVQFVLMVWMQIWSPLESRVISRRLAALGITPEQMQGGVYLGISDPSRSSFRKMTLVEDDLGMLWMLPKGLAYRGDADHFDVPRECFIAMERKADAGSTSALAGAVHIILRFLGPDGAERRVRLHPAGGFTLRQKARLMDALAARIQAWIDQAPAAPAPEEEVFVEPLDEEP